MKIENRWIAGMQVEVDYDDKLVPDPDIDWLLDYLQSEFGASTWPTEPMLLQVGMMLLQIRNSGNRITIFEPDMISLPIVFVEGVTNTLRILRSQKDAHKSLQMDSEMDFPEIRQFATQCRKWEDAASYVLERSSPNGNDSGWYFGCQNPEHDHENAENLKNVSILEIAMNYSDLVPFLALPSGSAVLVENDKPHVYFNGEEKLPRLGSFLSRLILKKG